MAAADMAVDQAPELASDVVPFARSYQLEALEKAIKGNTIAFLETGSGKTLIAIMLMRSYAHLLRKPSNYIAVFLVPTVVLVSQQSDVVKMHTDLKVGKYWGAMGVDYWNAVNWKDELDKHEVLVMTPMILLNALRHSFICIKQIKLLIFDECHNAKKKNPMAMIMKEFYHPLASPLQTELPRIFGMTASPVKAKGSSSAEAYWKDIRELENLMNSKVYTCADQSVLAKYISFPTAKFKYYEHGVSQFSAELENELYKLINKHADFLKGKPIKESSENSARKKLECLASTFLFCVRELGLWPTWKAARSLSFVDPDEFCGWRSGAFCKDVAESYSLDAEKLFSSYFPAEWTLCDDIKGSAEAGFLSKKVFTLYESLLEYRNIDFLRCIVFVERVFTAIARESSLNELLSRHCGWKAKYIAGNSHALQSQSRAQQNKIVNEFREGKVNIIVATSILEEGLDVQSCNVVIRFDPSYSVSSFIQSRGRARVKNSDFLLMVKSNDASALAQAKTYLDSVNVMRCESLKHSSIPCEPVGLDLYDSYSYRVESTGAVVNLNSSVALIYFYCSRLPSDGYFKPLPRCTIDEVLGTCTLQFPNNCPLQSVAVNGNSKILKQIACFEACKKLHELSALTDHLVPDTQVEEADVKEQLNELYHEEHTVYLPPELVIDGNDNQMVLCHSYLIEFRTNFDYHTPVQNVVLVVYAKLDIDIDSTVWEFETNHGSMGAALKYLGMIELTKDQVTLGKMFQVGIFKAMFDRDFGKIKEAVGKTPVSSQCAQLNYLVLPSTGQSSVSSAIDWRCVTSVLYERQHYPICHRNCSPSKSSSQVCTKNGLICRCVLQDCLVYTPHNGLLYCISGFLEHLNSNSRLGLNGDMSYKQYFKENYSITLCCENEVLLRARYIFRVQNFLSIGRQQKPKAILDVQRTYCELPPEICYVIMSPISVSTFYTFSLVPLVMHRIESLLIAANLQRMYTGCDQNLAIPTVKILEAITTKKCQESFHLESLETLGDSFLKYAVSQQLFKAHRDQHEGLLSLKREKITSNSALCKLGCEKRIPGFIRNQMFEPKNWLIPGYPGDMLLEEEWVGPNQKMYRRGTQMLKSKRVADVVEALIGAFLSNGGEVAAVAFMNWLGIEVDFSYVPYNRQFLVDARIYANVNYFESLLNYSFRNPSLLIEALTHGSYMKPEISRCYQRLEYLGDSVLDHLITLHIYTKHTGLSPGQLTDMRSASVNNECYAFSAFRVELYKHVLHASHDLHRDIVAAVHCFEDLRSQATFGWEVDFCFPKVLADVIESLAGAIFVDSGYNKDAVSRSMMPLLEPLVTPETLKLHPVQELHLLCQKHHFVMKKPSICRGDNAEATFTLEVEANGAVHSHTCVATDKDLALKIASRAVLKSLKDSIGEM